jgi:hypothetical protein
MLNRSSLPYGFNHQLRLIELDEMAAVLGCHQLSPRRLVDEPSLATPSMPRALAVSANGFAPALLKLTDSPSPGIVVWSSGRLKGFPA